MVTLCDGFAVLQAPVFDGLSFEFFSFKQDGLAAPEVGVGWREIAQALVVATVIVVRDKGLDLGLQITSAPPSAAGRRSFAVELRPQQALPR